MKESTRRLTWSALLVAVGVIGGGLVHFQIGPAKCSPIQHVVNVLAAIMLGPGPALLVAFCISLLRNLLGTGTLLAFPGSMAGAFLAGMMYRRFGRIGAAAAGEVFGTGILGALAAWPVAVLLMGRAAGAFFFVAPFLINSTVGATAAALLARTAGMIGLMRAKEEAADGRQG